MKNESEKRTHRILAVEHNEWVEITHCLMNAGRFLLVERLHRRAGLDVPDYTGKVEDKQ